MDWCVYNWRFCRNAIDKRNREENLQNKTKREGLDEPSLF